VLNAKVEKKLQQLETTKERKKNERIGSKVDGQTTDDSGRD
jgi:hypothetical protein